MAARTLTIAAAFSGALLGAFPAHADLPPFPDMSSYTPVDVGDYEIQLENAGRPYSLTSVYFRTPDGITCDFMPRSAQCTGNNFPAVPPATPNGVNWIKTDAALQQTGQGISSDGTIQHHPIRTLPPFHTITVDGVVCGVDDAGMTACKDPQGRGFVLSPQGSGWLPHV